MAEFLQRQEHQIVERDKPENSFSVFEKPRQRSNERKRGTKEAVVGSTVQMAAYWYTPMAAVTVPSKWRNFNLGYVPSVISLGQPRTTFQVVAGNVWTYYYNQLAYSKSNN